MVTINSWNLLDVKKTHALHLTIALQAALVCSNQACRSLIPRVTDVLTSVTSFIGYIYPLIDAAILTAIYNLCIPLHILLCQIS